MAKTISRRAPFTPLLVTLCTGFPATAIFGQAVLAADGESPRSAVKDAPADYPLGDVSALLLTRLTLA